MARAISDEEQQLKRRARRRLIGAIVLVAAIVVVLPMVLDSDPRQPGQPVSVKIPPTDAGVFTSKAVPQGSIGARQDPPAQEPAKDPVKPAAAPQADKAAPAEPTPPPKAAAAGVKPKTGQFVIQVIALADSARARRMQEKISAAGITSYTEVVKTQKGDVTRVRAGPFASRGDAERARDQLKKLGMNGNITAR